MIATSLDHAVSSLIVHYQTPDLLETAVRSFKRHYPEVELTIIDNGSKDDSPARIKRIIEDESHVSAQFLEENIFHGPGMDSGLQSASTQYVFVLDSDTETVRGGFLEQMVDVMRADPSSYGAGQVVHVDRRGFARPSGIPVLSSAHMLLDARHYRSLPRFIHHGLPALENFRAAQEAGLRLHSFPIREYVLHVGRGTASRYGYGLGLRAKVDYVLAKFGF